MRTSPAQQRAGRLISGLVVAFFLVDAGVALLAPDRLAGEMAKTGFPLALAAPLGWLDLILAAVYAMPRTSVLGAILIAGWAGGAVCTHFRLGEVGSVPQLICLAAGVLAWLGLYLRDARVRALLPLRQPGLGDWGA